jgi:aerobic-type carbon monoxide dehydrogenase small subunit (CoxS/CutS family)
MQVTINGGTSEVDVPADMPLSWVLRDVLGMTGTKFGCGMALCGACTVHLDGQPIRSCVTPVAAAADKRINYRTLRLNGRLVEAQRPIVAPQRGARHRGLSRPEHGDAGRDR